MHFFISHSAGEASAAVLKALREALRNAGHTVFDDSHIAPGTQWRSRIYHELALCHAAVLLLDKTSLQQRWVQREVDLLQWRRALNPSLEIVPVVLDDTRPGTVHDRGFGELTETQFLQAGQLGLEPETIAQTIVDRFAKITPAADCAMDQWFERIETVLELIGHTDRQHRAAVALGVPPDEANAVTLKGGSRFLAHQFLGRPADDALIEVVEWLVDAADVAILQRLVELIEPVWVDGSAALPLVPHRPPQPTVAVLNAKQSWTARQYVNRATCMKPAVQVVEVTARAGEEGAAGLRTMWERNMLIKLGTDPDSGGTITDISPRVVRDGPGYPMYLLVNAVLENTIVAAEAVRLIQKQFRWLVVILLVGSTAPSQAELDRWRLSDARVLEPPLAAFEETDARRRSVHLYDMLDRRSKGNRT